MGFGMTMVMVDKNTLQVLNDALEVMNEAVYMGVVDEETGDIARQSLTGLRDRIKVALGN